MNSSYNRTGTPRSAKKLRLHVLADLHLEFLPFDVTPTDADVVVLAGDVDVGRKGIDWIRDRFPGRQVIYVLGNHEYYHHIIPELAEALQNETSNSNIHILEKSAVEIQGITFIGCTLWTSFLDAQDLSAAMETAQMVINDYRLIRCAPDNRLLRAQDTARIHAESVAWLRGRVQQCDPARTVVVTHHSPSFQSEAPQHFNGPLSPAFASNLDSLIEQSGVALWVHGHTHHNVDYHIGSTRVLSNQRAMRGRAARDLILYSWLRYDAVAQT